jgi:hypothetical protein
MAGTLYSNDNRLANALCEGRHAAAIGLGDDTNPFTIMDPDTGPIPTPEGRAWDIGFDGWTVDPTIPHEDQDGCADAYGGGYVAPGKVAPAPPPSPSPPPDTPTDAWAKADIIAWLTDYIGKPEANLTKAELLTMVQEALDIP